VVTNREILAVDKQYPTISRTVAAIQEAYKLPVSDEYIRMKLHRLKKRVAMLSKNKNIRSRSEVMDTPFYSTAPETFDPFVLPETKQKMEKIQSKSHAVVLENRQLKRSLNVVTANNASLEAIVDRLTFKESILLDLQNSIVNKQNQLMMTCNDDIKTLEIENRDWNNRYNNLSTQLDSVTNLLQKKREQLSKLRTKNMSKKLKRRDDKIANQEQLLQSRNTELANVKSELDDVKSQNIVLKNDKFKMQKKLSIIKQKVATTALAEQDQIAIISKKMKALQAEIEIQKAKISELDDINSILQSKHFETFENGKYVNILRETVMYLLTECNISVGKVNQVIETVMNNLTGKLPTRLPSRGCLSRILVEAKSIAAQQVAKAMIDGANIDNFTGNCLHMDATTKYHHHYQGYEVYYVHET
jgi:chromosome segregation ATPase